MAKSEDTYRKVAETFKKKADKAYAVAKNEPGRGDQFDAAKRLYGTAAKATAKADELAKKKK